MKRIAILLLALLLGGVAWGQTYFGYCSSDGTWTGTYANRQYFAQNEMNWRDAPTTGGGDVCPGTGDQDITSMAVETSATGFNVQMAVYTNDGTLVVHTTNAKAAVDNGTVSWAANELTWDSGTTLTGGDRYKIAFIGSAAGAINGGVNGSIYVQRLEGSTSSFPSSLPTGTQGQEYFNVRVGVEDAAGGTVVPQLMYNRSQQ